MLKRIFIVISAGVLANFLYSVEVGEKIEQVLPQRSFEYFVAMDVSDYRYEIRTHYGFLIRQYTWVREKSDLNSELRLISKKALPLLKRTMDDRLRECQLITERYENPKLYKFVLSVPYVDNDKKQGLLVVENKIVVQVIWDDGIMLYDGIPEVSQEEASETQDDIGTRG